MLRLEKWKQARSKCQHYRRRSPEEGVLYQLAYDQRQELEYRWEEQFQSEYGYLRAEVLKAFDAYLNCGILEHGAARAYCDGCQHSLLVAFSCKKRGVCPSCAAKRAVKFAEYLYQAVLEDCDHRHMVFSLPKRLRPYLKYVRGLASHVFRAASLVRKLVPSAAGLLENDRASPRFNMNLDFLIEPKNHSSPTAA